jgi:hypothetical protein
LSIGGLYYVGLTQFNNLNTGIAESMHESVKAPHPSPLPQGEGTKL